MKIIADENIPFAREAFDTLGEVTLVAGRALSAEHVAGADVLFVRSVTPVNAALLDGSHVRFVGSATAGTDNVDAEYLERHGIGFAAAPGCNANSVGEYMAAAWLALAVREGARIEGRTVGIVGAGHTGSAAERKARALGMVPVLNDPPLARETGDGKYRPLEEALDCDIVTCHTPLTYDGPDPTYHLACADFFGRMKDGAWFCNAGRGEVVDSAALHEAIDRGRLGAVILDVWEREPAIDGELLKKVAVGTPHIAGYSHDGKVNGTTMVYEAACRFFGIEPQWNAQDAMPEPEMPEVHVDATGRDDEAVLHELVGRVYPIERDDEALRATADLAANERGRTFDGLRKEYPRRREFGHTRVRLDGASDSLRAKAHGLGFIVEQRTETNKPHGVVMQYFAEGSPTTVIGKTQAAELVGRMLDELGPLRRVLILPPDLTRLHSWAGEITVMLYERLKASAHVELLPTLGTHEPMTTDELGTMFPGVPPEVFRPHNWRVDLVRLGEVPGEFTREVSEGKLDYPIACEVNKLIVEGEWDRIISVGQLVPHEVSGIANYNKNVFIGAGGADAINKTHFLGAVYGMERMMGRADTPVRKVLDYMTANFAQELPLSYVLTVRALDESGALVTRGLYAGDDDECFLQGAELCRRVNVDLLDEPIEKAVVYLDPAEFKSTWLGNKAIYRTRMAMADGGELVILAPGVRRFGEDAEVDRLIRAYGYRGTPATLRAVEQHADLAANLSAAAHLIHGSSEGRFAITYCAGQLTRNEVEGVGFRHADLDEMMGTYDPAKLAEGTNTLPTGEQVFYISNPGLGLWALRSQFEE